MRNKKELVLVSAIMAGVAGIAAEHIISKRLHPQRLSILENIPVFYDGLQASVNAWLKASDPMIYSRFLEASRSMPPEERAKLISELPISRRARLQTDLMVEKDFPYRFEQSFRERLINQKYTALSLTSQLGRSTWRDVGKIIAGQNRNLEVAPLLNGILPSEYSHVSYQFQDQFLEINPDGTPKVELVVLKKKDQVVGVMALTISDASLFDQKPLGSISLVDLKESRKFGNEKNLTVINVIPAPGQKETDLLALAMYAAADLANDRGIETVRAIGLFDKNEAETVNGVDYEGNWKHEGHRRLALFGSSILDKNEQLVVSDKFVGDKTAFWMKMPKIVPDSTLGPLPRVFSS